MKAKEMFETVTKKLLNKYGLKTLAKGEENYIDIYEGNSFKNTILFFFQWILLRFFFIVIYNAYRGCFYKKVSCSKDQAISYYIQYKETKLSKIWKNYGNDADKANLFISIGTICIYETNQTNAL